MSRWRTGALGTLLLVPVLAEASAGELEGQSVVRLAEACHAAETALVVPCRNGALAAREVQGGIGLALAGGALLPGSGSTLGHRVEGAPRVSLNLRTSGTRMRMPHHARAGAEPVPATSFLAPSVQLGVTVGILDGFSLAPTVGGVLSLDAVGHANVVSLPTDHGFAGPAATYGAGLRLGLLRESFTLPGATLSAAHHRGGSVRRGSLLEGDPVRVDVSPSVTSFRLVAERDLLLAGVLAGVGVDRTSGQATVRAQVPGAVEAPGAGEGRVSSLSSRRRVAFIGANLTFLVMRVSAELAWAGSHSAVAGWEDQAFRSERGWSGGVGVRVTY